MNIPQAADLRLLIVEDEALVSMMIEDILTELGCTVIGPAGTVEQALRLIEDRPFDGALLDLNLGGEDAAPIAEALAARGIPFVFVTGYSNTRVQKKFPAARTIQKPFDEMTIAAAVRDIGDTIRQHG